HGVEALAVPDLAPGRAHAKARGAGILGPLRGAAHGFRRQELLVRDARFVMGALGAVPAVFGTAPRLDAEQRTALDGGRVVMAPMDGLGPEDQLGERQSVERLH